MATPTRTRRAPECGELLEWTYSCRRMMAADMACGSGIYSTTLCAHWPGLHAILIDRPEVLDAARAHVAASGPVERIAFAARDFLVDDYGEARDVVLFSDVLYRSDEACLTMLREALRALAPGGLVVVRGCYPDVACDRSPFAALFDLDRLLWDEARSPLPCARVTAMLEEVGFREVRRFPLTESSVGMTARR